MVHSITYMNSEWGQRSINRTPPAKFVILTENLRMVKNSEYKSSFTYRVSKLTHWQSRWLTCDKVIELLFQTQNPNVTRFCKLHAGLHVIRSLSIFLKHKP